MRINFPFNPISATATSASLSETSLFLNNIGTPINSASVGLNITGSTGAAGVDAIKVGVVGDRGETGDPAQDGLNIYLLSSIRSTCGGCPAGSIPPDVETYPPTGCPLNWTFDPISGCCLSNQQ